MNKQLLIYVGIAAVIVAAVGLVVVNGDKGSHLRLDGQILKIRTGPLGDQASIAVVDFRVNNPSNVPFVVNTVEMSLEKKDGGIVDGFTVAKSDLKRIFEYNRFLGLAYNDGLSIQDTIAPHATMDRMVAGRFDVNEHDLNAAKALHMTITSSTGTTWETSHSVQ